MSTHRAEPLNEGMRAGDLKDLVLPLISVDEYVSKTDEDKAIVVGFYVHDQTAAQDLNRFIQKSAMPLIDTEVSPAPDQHGFFLVFVEFLGNERFPANVKNLLDEITTLSDIDEWTMRVRGTEGVISFSEDALKKALETAAGDTNVTESVFMEFFRESALSGIKIHDRRLILEAGHVHIPVMPLGIGHVEEIIATHRLDETPLDLDMTSVAACRRLEVMLGEGWDVASVGGHLVLRKGSTCMVASMLR